MSLLDKILVLTNNMVGSLTIVFFFMLALIYLRKAKSAAGLLLTFGLALLLPYNISVLYISGSTLLFILHIISHSVIGFPIYWEYLEVMVYIGHVLIIAGFCVGIRKLHAMKKKGGIT